METSAEHSMRLHTMILPCRKMHAISISLASKHQFK